MALSPNVYSEDRLRHDASSRNSQASMWSQLRWSYVEGLFAPITQPPTSLQPTIPSTHSDNERREDLVETTAIPIYHQPYESGATNDAGARKINESAVKPNLRIRNFSIAGTVITLILSVVCLTYGIILVKRGRTPIPSFVAGTMVCIGLFRVGFRKKTRWIVGHTVVHSTMIIAKASPLLLNLALAMLLSCVSRIQNVTLRWALHKEGRLDFNSNPKLFSFVRWSTHAPNHWSIKTLSMISLAVIYGASSLMSNSVYIVGYVDIDDDGNVSLIKDKPYHGEPYALDFSGYPIVFLGAGLLIQVAIAFSCLALGWKIVKTWSENPLMTAIAARESSQEKDYHLSQERVLKVDSDGKCSSHLYSGPPNRSARDDVPSLRFTIYVLYLFALISVVGTIVVAIISVRNGTTSRAGVIKQGGQPGIYGYWEAWGVAYFEFVPSALSHNRCDWLGVLVQSAVQLIPSVVLEAFDHTLSLWCDERMWRKASRKRKRRSWKTLWNQGKYGATEKMAHHDTNDSSDEPPVQRNGSGAETDLPVLRSILDQWPPRFFTIFTGVLQWSFGEAFRVNSDAYFILIPTIVFTTLVLIAVTVAELIARHKPVGEQPVTYGNIQKLIEYMNGFTGDVFVWELHGKRPKLDSPETSVENSSGEIQSGG